MNYKEEQKEIDLMQYWSIILKRRWIAITFASAVILLTAIFTFTTEPIYRATATLLIEEETSKRLSIEDEFDYGRQVPSLRDFNTQLNLMKSLALGDKVVKKLNLSSRMEFSSENGPNKSLLSDLKDFLTLKWIFSKKKNNESDMMPLALSNSYSAFAHMIVNGITAEPIRDTKLVKVSYESPSPNLSAEIVNAFSEEFKVFLVKIKAEATQEASNFLTDTIASLQEDLDDKSRELQRYGYEKDIPLSDTENSIISNFSKYDDAYTQARIQTVAARNAYDQLKNASPDFIPSSLDNPYIAQLREDYINYKSQYEDRRSRLGERHREVIQLRNSIESTENLLIEEIEKARKTAEAEYNYAFRQEQQFSRLRNEERAKIAETGSDLTRVKSLQTEVDNIKRQIESYTRMQGEAEVSRRLEEMETSNISVIDKAAVPRQPVSPSKRKNLMLAFLVGVMGGVGLCFLLEYLDNTIKSPEDVEEISGLPSLGLIPFLPPEGMDSKKRDSYISRYGEYSTYGDELSEGKEKVEEIKEIELVNFLFPRFFISEDYRTVRTSILLSNADNPPKSLLISSAVPKEGKTTTASNLAVAFSQLSEKVLIVDSDLRRPRLNKIFQVKNIGGLSSYLAGKISLEDSIKMTAVDNIWILPSGPIPPNPSELLNAEKMKELMCAAEEKFDIVIIDTPPVLAAIDTIVLSSLVDSIILVIRAGQTTNKTFLNALDKLKRTKTNIVGVVLNEVKIERGDRYYYKSTRREYIGY